MTPEPPPRALLSVYDKAGLVELGRGLSELGYELVASGGTARALRLADLSVTPVSTVTGHPEILEGRVKTLHPAVHGGILARRTTQHLLELADHGIAPIDIVVCNLYPFVQTIEEGGSEAEAVEQIDIGGVTLLRAAAKNFESVTTLCDPADYGAALTGLADGRMDVTRRRRLALKAFRHTAAYDGAIAAWLQEGTSRCGAPTAEVSGDGLFDGLPETLPEILHLRAERDRTLRYGENPHQVAAFYRRAGQEPCFSVVRGARELSYNNLIDLGAAWAVVGEFDRPAVALVKHTNPCGLALGETPVEAFRKALACDPISAFGSIIASNRPVDEGFVAAWGKLFVEVLVAPGFSPEAIARLARRKKGCRVVRATGRRRPAVSVRAFWDGLLVQSTDRRGVDRGAWRVATRRSPTEAEAEDLAFCWLVAKHARSNAIVLAKGGATVGIGPGQPNRLESVRIAAGNAGERAVGSVCASDAFFPFDDGLRAAVAAGATAVIQPGGSIRDTEVIAAADELGIAMVLTGERHFLH